MTISFKGAHFPQEIILMGVRWYLAYPLSYRHVEELMEERGVDVDHSTINRWVIKYSPQLEIYQSYNLHKTLCQPKNRLRDCRTVEQEQ
jgi:transposase-like protein